MAICHPSIAADVRVWVWWESSAWPLFPTALPPAASRTEAPLPVPLLNEGRLALWPPKSQCPSGGTPCTSWLEPWGAWARVALAAWGATLRWLSGRQKRRGTNPSSQGGCVEHTTTRQPAALPLTRSHSPTHFNIRAGPHDGILLRHRLPHLSPHIFHFDSWYHNTISLLVYIYIPTSSSPGIHSPVLH